MSQISLVVSREYLSRVKKKSFLLTTFLVPLLIIGFYVAVIAVSLSGSSDLQKIAILDEANIFNGKADTSHKTLTFTFIQDQTEAGFVNTYHQQGYDAFLYIPKDSLSKIVFHTPFSANMTVMTALENVVNDARQKNRLRQKGIDPGLFTELTQQVSLVNAVDSKKGSQKSEAGIAYIVSFACGFLIYLMMLIYGTQVMRGVSEEKTNRIAEVMVSSVKPFDLMMGKILGIGAVGLTQFIIWMLVMLGLQTILPIFFPDMMHQLTDSAVTTGGSASMAATVVQSLAVLPLGKILFCFVFYFLSGYLMYASLFAALGSVVSEDPQEAQKMTFPITMPILLSFIMMTKAINDPNSTMAVVGSIFPLTSPIVMMARITYEVPVWQLLLSMGALVGGFMFMTWISARIYRIGILMYGKKPSWKEMMRWAFKK